MVNNQQFLNAISKNIDMVRGDTLAFCFQLSGLGSQAAYEALEVSFAVTDNYNKTAIIEVTNGAGVELDDYADDTATFSVTVAPELTKDMDTARYFYDLQIKDTDNTITLMRGILTLLPEVAG